MFVFASTQYIETVMIFHADYGSVEVEWVLGEQVEKGDTHKRMSGCETVWFAYKIEL